MDIAEANQEKRTWKEIVLKHYLPYKEVFEKQTFDQLPPQQPWDHAIKLTEGAKGVDCKIYPLNPTEQQQLEEFLKEQLETGRICPSKSPMASPFFFVKKKDGKLRPVQDYQKLNEMTIKNHYPLPLILELINQLTGAKYFSKMDVWCRSPSRHFKVTVAKLAGLKNLSSQGDGPVDPDQAPNILSAVK